MLAHCSDNRRALQMISIRHYSALVFAVASSACASVPRGGASAVCVKDKAAFLSLDYEAFDQDVTPGGWRRVAKSERCAAAAAELIADWREMHAKTLSADQMQTLWWHEGQVLASAGNYEAAIPRFETSRTLHNDRPPPPDAPADAVEMWRANITVRKAWEDATLAFLRRDRTGLDAARARMLAVPEPAGYSRLQDVIEEKAGTRIAWPLNIENVELMLACFDYRYGVDCRDQKAR